MNLYEPMKDEDRPFFSSKMLACPLRGHFISFQLVDEFGDGKPYGGLAYTLQDSAEQQYSGRLDADGFAKIEDCYQGPVVLMLNAEYVGEENPYKTLMERPSYKLPITELQVRAEQTRFFHTDGLPREHNPALKPGDKFIQVEVRDLVKHSAHLPPPIVDRKYPPEDILIRALNELRFSPEPVVTFGVGLLSNRHTVLQVRPLRAFRPMLSTDNKFCALNLYQLAIMANLSYCDFGQHPAKDPVDRVSFPLDPSVGHFFGEALSNFRESWKVDNSQSPVHRYYPLYEEVSYSKRFEILPFDPTLYEQNKPGEKQEHPAKLHFFDDTSTHWLSAKSTQAFITHHDEVILIAIRGTLELADWWRDLDAEQVPFEEGQGKVHRGFYEAYKALKKFVQDYLFRFYIGQKIIISGHSLGGAIALLLAEALRCDKAQKYDILLYTYGSPRAGDATFVAAAEPLAHHRTVNNNDMIPSVPAPWMNARRNIWIPGFKSLFITNPVLGALIFVAGLVRVGGAPYQHHGKLHHFMLVPFNPKEMSSILWQPGCDSIEQAACTRALAQDGDLPYREGWITQLMSLGDHSIPGAYIPLSWVTLRRWQQTQETRGTLVTDREYALLEKALKAMRAKVQDKSWHMHNSQRDLNDPDYQQAEADLSRESGKLVASLQRLSLLNATKLTLANVYGSAAQSPTFDVALARWKDQRENTQQVQIAMIPEPNRVEEMLAGTRIKPYVRDLDSLI